LAEPDATESALVSPNSIGEFAEMTGKVMKTKSKTSGHIIRSGEDTRTYEINHA
jgi:hypothetical protein